MEDVRGESQVCSRCNKEVARPNIAPELHDHLLYLCPGCEEAIPQEGPKPHDTDQHSQSQESESPLQCGEVMQQELPLENPTDHTVDSSSPVESCSDRNGPFAEEDGTDHALPQEGTLNHSHSQTAKTTEACWYCMKSLNTDALKKLQPLSKGKRVSYQLDPRPHFGVPRSSRSTTFPLWGCEGPLKGDRRAEESDQMSTCPHCHLALPLDTLRWHETKCLIFEGLKNSLGK